MPIGSGAVLFPVLVPLMAKIMKRILSMVGKKSTITEISKKMEYY